jgi:hypothetical protein
MTAGRPKVNDGRLIKVEIELDTKQRLQKYQGATINKKIETALNERSQAIQASEEYAKHLHSTINKIEMALRDSNSRIKFFRKHGKEFGFPFPPWQDDGHTAIGASFCLVTYLDKPLTSIPRQSFGFGCGCHQCRGKTPMNERYFAGECRSVLG